MQEKRLKPSMREKKRYLLLETGASRNEIEQAILDYVGVLGYAKAAPVFIKSNIIAVNREEADKVRASFALGEKLIKIRKASGTLKGLA
ncbi:MAG TPA: hypothetical protein VJA86_02540 [Candidatus Nanoarchaeia archaeon]|nr:hypothetical protein [Candidatus Nanoarchaeia archaeon]